jgi:hypothetical protein
MRFRWNNAWQASLSVFERQQVSMHEKRHVPYAKNLTDDQKDELMEEILFFSRGYPCPEPLGEKDGLDDKPGVSSGKRALCRMDVSKEGFGKSLKEHLAGMASSWNIAPFDIAVNDAFKEKS